MLVFRSAGSWGERGGRGGGAIGGEGGGAGAAMGGGGVEREVGGGMALGLRVGAGEEVEDAWWEREARVDFEEALEARAVVVEEEGAARWEGVDSSFFLSSASSSSSQCWKVLAEEKILLMLGVLGFATAFDQERE